MQRLVVRDELWCVPFGREDLTAEATEQGRLESPPIRSSRDLVKKKYSNRMMSRGVSQNDQ